MRESRPCLALIYRPRVAHNQIGRLVYKLYRYLLAVFSPVNSKSITSNMSLAALTLLACVVGPSVAYPIDLSLATDLGYDDSYNVPWGSDVYCRGISCSRTQGALDAYGTALASGVWGLNPTALSADLLTSSVYPKSVDVAKENFIRGSPFTGATEVGIRDEVTVRPSLLRSPYSKFYPYGAVRTGVYRYPLGGAYAGLVSDYDLALARSGANTVGVSLLGSLASDSLYLK